MLPRTVFLRRPAFLRRSVLAVVAGAAAAGLTSLSASAADDKPKPPASAAALKPILVKLYAKTGFDDGIGRSALHDDLQNVVLPPKSKDRKTADLKPTWWWSETIQEALYAGTNMVKQPGKTKDVVKSEFDCFPNGLDKISAADDAHKKTVLDALAKINAEKQARAALSENLATGPAFPVRST